MFANIMKLLLHIIENSIQSAYARDEQKTIIQGSGKSEPLKRGCNLKTKPSHCHMKAIPRRRSIATREGSSSSDARQINSVEGARRVSETRGEI